MPVVGVDISSWQTGINPASSKVPLGFAIFKSSEGLYPDSRYRQFYAQSVGKIPILGAYHYYRSGYGVADQVKTILSSTAGTSPNFYAIDFEGTGNILNAQAAKNTLTMIDVLHAITGKPVYLYTNQSLYNQFFKGSNAPLWLSAPSGVSINANPTFVQTGLNVPGAAYGVSGGSADVNIFPGTGAQLAQALGLAGQQGVTQTIGGNNVPALQNIQGSVGTKQQNFMPNIQVNLLPQPVTNFLSSPDLAMTVAFWVIGLVLIWVGFGMLIAPAAVAVAQPVVKAGVKAALV